MWQQGKRGIIYMSRPPENEIRQGLWQMDVPASFRLTIDGKIMVRCPKCKRELQLTYHSIAADGSLTPSFVCPWDRINKSCDFHTMVRLEGWNLGECK